MQSRCRKDLRAFGELRGENRVQNLELAVSSVCGGHSDKQECRVSFANHPKENPLKDYKQAVDCAVFNLVL